MLKSLNDFVFNCLGDQIEMNIFEETLNAYDKNIEELKQQIEYAIGENTALIIAIKDCQVVMRMKNREYDEKIAALTSKIDLASKLSKKAGEASFFSPERQKVVFLREGKIIDNEKEFLQKKVKEQKVDIQKLQGRIGELEYANQCLESDVESLREFNNTLLLNKKANFDKLTHVANIYENLCKEFSKENERISNIKTVGDYFTCDPFFIDTSNKTWKECYQEAHEKNNKLCTLLSSMQKQLNKSNTVIVNQNLSFFQAINNYLNDNENNGNTNV